MRNRPRIADMLKYGGRKANRQVDQAHNPSPATNMRDTPVNEYPEGRGDIDAIQRRYADGARQRAWKERNTGTGYGL